MDYLDTLMSWLQSIPYKSKILFQAMLLIIFAILCAAMAVKEVHTGTYTRQQKNVAILAFVVFMLVVVGVVWGLVNR